MLLHLPKRVPMMHHHVNSPYEACIQSGVFRSKSVPLSFLKCPIETSSSLSACHCVSCFFLLAADLLSPGEAGQEYPLPYQQRGPGQVSDYQSGGAHQPDRGETTDTWRKHLSCWSKSKAVQHTLHKSSVSWLEQLKKGFKLLKKYLYIFILNTCQPSLWSCDLSVSPDWTVLLTAAKMLKRVQVFSWFVSSRSADWNYTSSFPCRLQILI